MGRPGDECPTTCSESPKFQPLVVFKKEVGVPRDTPDRSNLAPRPIQFSHLFEPLTRSEPKSIQLKFGKKCDGNSTRNICVVPQTRPCNDERLKEHGDGCCYEINDK